MRGALAATLTLALTLALLGCADRASALASGGGNGKAAGAHGALKGRERARSTLTGPGRAGAPGGAGLESPVRAERPERPLMDATSLDAGLARTRRRMSFDQLAISVRQITGGVGWIVEEGGLEVDRFSALAAEWRLAEQVELSPEEQLPDEAFLRVLDAAARAVCPEMLARDASRPVEDRLLARYLDPDEPLSAAPAAVTENLQHLVLHFHGRRLSVDDPDLALWRWMLETAHLVTGRPAEAWVAVCVGLIGHPDFYTY